MMRERLLALAVRRAALVEQARTGREALAALVERGEAATSWIAGARRLLEEAARRPLLVVAAATLLLALRPRRALAWIAGGWSLLRMYRRARRWWARLSPLARA